MTRTRVTGVESQGEHWAVTLTDADTGDTRQVTARMLVNAAGPWVADMIHNTLRINAPAGVRLVRGSHIVVPRLYDHDKCYFFQGQDGRIIFAIPYEEDFTLIGTTDADHDAPDVKPECTEEEADYLCAFASQYFEQPVTRDQVVWTYSGVRPLYDDGATSATAATRDYVLKVDDTGTAPVLSVFGGKITTYRRLAESALDKIAPYFPGLPGKWTAGVPLPGGDFPVDGVDGLIAQLRAAHPFLSARHAKRLIRGYGAEAAEMLHGATAPADLGRDFGAELYEVEVRWLMDREFARRAEDVLWRRTKLGLHLDDAQAAALDSWMAANAPQGG